MIPSLSVEGKVAVVTGGGGVMCSVIAKGLAQAGAKIAILNRTLSKGQAVADEIVAAGGDAIAVSVDVMDRESVEQAAAQVKAHYGRVDILINGAGGNHPDATTGPDKSFFDLPTDAIRRVMDLNFLGSVIPSQVFGKIMVEQDKGSIVNIASMSSFHPLTKTLAYCAGKSAIANFTEWAAAHFCKEYSPNIRVNAIAPGFLLTSQNKYLLQNEDGSDTSRGCAVKDKTPMGRYGRPDEMVGAVIYLCSDAASFTTGVVIPVDGGFNAYWGV